jgi:IS30 family transposase
LLFFAINLFSCVNICNIRNHKSIVNERRSKILGLLTRGLKNFEIANMLNVDAATISRDISALTIDSQNYLNSLARETLPFMYEQSIEGIREVIKESYAIHQSQDPKVNMYQKLGALRLIKDCHEAIFHLIDEGPSVMLLKQLQEKMLVIESGQIVK